MDRQCSSCGGFCKKSGCERENVKLEPEPVAWFCELPDNKISIKIVGKPTEGNWKPLYTAPPQREWQGLTDAEAENIIDDCWDDPDMFIEAIEHVLRRKNS